MKLMILRENTYADGLTAQRNILSQQHYISILKQNMMIIQLRMNTTNTPYRTSNHWEKFKEVVLLLKNNNNNNKNKTQRISNKLKN